MSGVRTYTRNLAASWIGYGANMVVLFFLSPFVVGHLGDAAYGVWSTIVSLTGYLGLVEMGTRAALGRSINFYVGRNDMAKLNAMFSTAIVSFMATGVVLIGAACIVGLFWDKLFQKFPAGLLSTSRIALVLVAVDMWLSLCGAGFRQVLAACDRFDLINMTDIVVLGLRAAGTVILLKNGGALLALASLQVCSSVLGVTGIILLAQRAFPDLVIRLRSASWAHYRELFSFGIWAFCGSATVQIVSWSGLIIIGIFLGPAQVTFYAIPLMLVQTARAIVDHTHWVLGPQAMKACGAGDFAMIRSLYSSASMAVAFVSIPLFLGLMVYGRDFLILWMGDKFATSGMILTLLAFSQPLDMLLRAASGVILGLDRVRYTAICGVLQSVATLGIALGLIGFLGSAGVALGVGIPTVFFAPFLIGRVLRWTHFSLGDFFRHGVLRWLIYAGLVAAIFCGTYALWPHDRWLLLGSKVALLAVLCCLLGWAVLLSRQQRLKLAIVLRARIARKLKGTATHDIS